MNGFIKHQYSNSVYNTERGFNREKKLLTDNYIYNNSIQQPSEISFLNNKINSNKDFQNIKTFNLKNEKISLTEPSSIEFEKVKQLNPNTQYIYNPINNQNLKQNIINDSNKIKNEDNNFQNNFIETQKNNLGNTYIKKTNLKNNNSQFNQYRKINHTQNSNYNNYRMNKINQTKNYNSNNQNSLIKNSQIYNPIYENNNNYNIFYNYQSNPIKINNEIKNNQKNDTNYYKYINQSKNNFSNGKISSPNITNQNSFNEDDKENNIKRNKSMSPNPLIYTPNINNYQNNFYVQYTTPKIENLYYKEKINEIENESTNSINLSILADDLIQGFELDKKSNLEEQNKNKLIEESILQYDNNDIFIPLNSTIKQMRKNIDEFKIRNFSEDKKEDENELSKTLIINKNNEYYNNINQQNEFSQTLNNPHLIRKNLFHQNIKVKNQNYQNHNYQTRTRNINKPLENNNFNILNNEFKNQIDNNDNIYNNKINNKNINEQKLDNKNIKKENSQQQNIHLEKSKNQEEFKIEGNNDYIETNNNIMKKSITEIYNPVNNNIILEVSENKELSMTSKLDLESTLKNSTINSQLKDSISQSQNKIDDIKKNSINKNLIKDRELFNENPIKKIYNNNQINININEPFLEDSDEENNLILKEIIKNAKLKELKEKEEKDERLKNNKSKVVFQFDNDIELLYDSNDKITKMDILHLNNNKIEKIKEKNISSYISLLKSNNKPKSIIKKYNKSEILINENFVMDFIDSSDLEYSPDDDEENR